MDFFFFLTLVLQWLERSLSYLAVPQELWTTARSRSQFLHSALCAFASHLLFLWPVPESTAVAGVSQSGHQQAGKLLSGGQSPQ